MLEPQVNQMFIQLLLNTSKDKKTASWENSLFHFRAALLEIIWDYII